MIEANNPALKSWVAVPAQSHFPIQNLPFGIFSSPNCPGKRVGVAIGQHVLDLDVLHTRGFLRSLDLPPGTCAQPSLNALMALGRPQARKLRQRLSELLRHDNTELQQDAEACQQALVPMEQATLHMPMAIGDYTDFYSSMEHATNVGTMFRDPKNALLPNWKHLPVGYHGRASSIIVSGTPIHRPQGQTRPDDAAPPVFGPTRLLDFELEMAFVTCQATALGQSVPVAQAEEHIWGMVIFNDWSARDIQKWEYVPLGPFLAKSFASSISPWVVTLDALEPFRVQGPKQDPAVLPYLQQPGAGHFDIALEVAIQPQNSTEHVVCQSNTKYLYWTMAQQLAHQTVNGCNINVADVYASGTISGPEPHQYGSMLELSWRGTRPISMPNGTERKFVQDHDTVTMRAWGQHNGLRIGFGQVSTQVLPAL